MSYEEFVNLVKQMRQAQKDSFMWREKGLNKLSKELERKVDEAIAEMEHGKQGGLW